MRGNTQGLTLGISHAAIRSRLRSREVSERRQVGDAEGMVNDGSRMRGEERRDEL